MSFNAVRIWLLVAIVGLLAVLMLTVNLYLNDEPINTLNLVVMLTADVASLFNLWHLLKVWRKVRREERAKRKKVQR